MAGKMEYGNMHTGNPTGAVPPTATDKIYEHGHPLPQHLSYQSWQDIQSIPWNPITYFTPVVFIGAVLILGLYIWVYKLHNKKTDDFLTKIR